MITHNGKRFNLRRAVKADSAAQISFASKAFSCFKSRFRGFIIMFSIFSN